MSRRTAWITGAGGLIGAQLVRTPAKSGYAPRGLTRSDVDLHDSTSVRRLFQQEQPALVIHCAALSKNPACEANPALARRTNVEATAILTELASDIPFIFLSTDLVFDGTKGDYREEDTPNPLSVYAETKVAAEQVVQRHPRHAIVRLSLTGGVSPTADRGFNEEMENAWRAGRILNLFTDEFRCPLAASVVAEAVWELASTEAGGTYHLCGSEKLSRWDIGHLLAERHPELAPRIVAGSRKEYQGPPRPADTSMNCAKVQQLLSFPLPAFSEWLRSRPQEPF